MSRFPGLAAWRRMAPLERYSLYNRWSLHALLILVTLVNLLAMISAGRGQEGLAPLVTVTVALLVALLIAGVLALELHPGLNARPRADHRRWLRACSVLALVVCGTWLLLHGAVIAGLLPPLDARGAGIVLIGIYAPITVVSLVHIPRMRHRWAAMTALALAVTIVTYPLHVEPVQTVCILLTPPIMTSATTGSLWAVRILREAERSRTLAAELSATEERLRIAQELHDTMGQDLAAMSLTTELALALAQRGDARAVSELEALRSLMRRSTAHMRQVVQGYRVIDLPTELAGARSLLSTAGIEVTVRGQCDQVPAAQQQTAAWFMRETATNVLRHASATQVTITIGADGVSVGNDGVAGRLGPLSGLEALRRRAEALDSRIIIDHRPPAFTSHLRFTADEEESA
ncbi:hypothetical protein J5X07_10145 [Actinomyces bowdenii]|uniref:sensor histidine kinase n=1 Tax=Actinomyces bowdenii TaxID=131109 RepID=UPI001ABBFE26|nr:hypothetical protein [Actinomyces bowdenii]